MSERRREKSRGREGGRGRERQTDREQAQRRGRQWREERRGETEEKRGDRKEEEITYSVSQRKKIKNRAINSYYLTLICPPKAHMLKARSPANGVIGR
jgi:hypothetical protein